MLLKVERTKAFPMNTDDSTTEPQWLIWAKRLQALSQIGLTYSKDTFDLERYRAIRDISAEMMAAGSDVALETVSGLFRDQSGYATPKVDTRGVVFRGQSILLVREREDGCWTLPGGWADVLESPREAVEREVREESGYETRAVKLLALYDRSKHPHTPPFHFHIYKLFIRCEVLGGSSSASGETSEVAFFSEDSLPELSLSRVTPQQIRRLFEYLRDPQLPTDFD
jgi:ADP-ribose pyrophosphatase YjhB (NUDIX family)